MKEDRGTQYCIDTLAGGKSLAGPFVRGSCQRHLNDLEKSKTDPNYPYYYDLDEAIESIAFFEEILCLNGGQFEGKPFILLPWEAFIISSIFGWKRKSDDTRRFRVAYIETPKGSGKSPVAAGIGIKGLVADNESRAEIYAAATLKDQAMVLFRDAVAFYDQSPELQKRLVASGTGENRWNLAYPDTGSFFRVISSDNKRGKSGPRPHIALLDEIHEHANGNVIEMLRAGFKFRRNPLSFMITNSGYDRTTVCWEYHELGTKVALGEKQNDEFFSYICSFDEEDLVDDRYLEDETLWAKINPSLDAGIPGYDYIRGQVCEARGLPSKMSTVKRLCFCQWVESENPAVSKEAWEACEDKDYPMELLDGRRCWGGLDLSAVNDLTSYGLIFEPSIDDPFWRLKVWFWVPGEGLYKKENTDHYPYLAWRDNGYLFTSAGEAISKTQVIRFIYETSIKYDIVGIAYDRNRMKDFIEFADKEGIDLDIGEWDKKNRQWIFTNQGIRLMPFGQEARSMTPAIDKFEYLLLERMIRHDGNPVLRMCTANAVVDSDGDYRRYSKKHSIGRIDGLQVTAMACGILEDTQTKSEVDGMSVEEQIRRMTGG